MNRAIIIGSIILLLVLGVLVWIGLSFEAPTIDEPTEPTTPVSAPVSSGAQDRSTTAVKQVYGTAVAQNNFDNIKLYETILLDEWAIQVWKGDNLGGEALLKYDNSQMKWSIIDPGGGSWSVEALVDAGVPQPTAAALLAPLR